MLQHKQIKSDTETINLLLSVTDNDFELVESILGIEFAYVDGHFQSDLYENILLNEEEQIDENQDIDTTKFRKDVENGFPTHYPCIAIYSFEKSFDRCGTYLIQLLDFVYQEEFNC